MDTKLPSLLKPSLETKFRVDFDWWRTRDHNWRIYLQSFLCEEHQKLFANYSYTDQIDLVNPETGEVTQGDAMLHVLIHHCAKQASFHSENSALVDSLFKIFLVNNNQPLTSVELSAMLGKPAEIILKTIGTAKVYKGIRPV